MTITMIRNSLFKQLTRSLGPPTTPSIAMSRRSVTTLRDHLYFNRATAEGPGRCGPVSSNGDSPLSLHLSRPKRIGGKGDGQTPEQLLAMGYSSSFLSALEGATAKAGKNGLAHGAKVHTIVYFGPPKTPAVDGFGLSVDIVVEGVDDDDVILTAHDMCPFSRAFQQGIEVNVRKMPR